MNTQAQKHERIFHLQLISNEISEGGIIMGVNPRNAEDAEYFENDWRNNKGQHVYR